MCSNVTDATIQVVAHWFQGGWLRLAGDPSRFRSLAGARSFSGLVPSLNASGASGRHGRPTRRGDAVLREAIFIAADHARRIDPTLAARSQRLTPEQIVRKLRQVERLLGEGQTIGEAAKQVEISEQTYHRWRNQYGGMKADDAKRLRELERENARLKRIVADKELEIDALRPGKLVSPSRRREAVCMLQDRLELSERRACRVTGQHRSTQRRVAARGRGDDALRTELHAFSRGHPRWGYAGRGRPCARRDGACRKRVQRLWREEGLRVKRRKRQRRGTRRCPPPGCALSGRLGAGLPVRPAADGRVLKLLNIVDEHTREALAIVAARSINADATASTLDRIVAGRGTRRDTSVVITGPSSRPTRDWCRFSGTGSSYIEPGDGSRSAAATSSWSSSSTASRCRCEDWRIGARTAAGLSPRLPTPSAGTQLHAGPHKRWSREGGPVNPAARSQRLMVSAGKHHNSAL